MQFWTTFEPLPHRDTFYYQGLGTAVTKLLTPPPYDCDIIYGRPLSRLLQNG